MVVKLPLSACQLNTEKPASLVIKITTIQDWSMANAILQNGQNFPRHWVLTELRHLVRCNFQYGHSREKTSVGLLPVHWRILKVIRFQKGNDGFLITESYGIRFCCWRIENAVFIVARGWSNMFKKETYFWIVDKLIKNESFDYLTYILQEYWYLFNKFICASLPLTDYRRMDKWRYPICMVFCFSRVNVYPVGSIV